jgi:cytochrome c peroxidase
VRTARDFAAKGVEEIICVAVNDPHVLRYWAQASGAEAAGIAVLADPASAFTKAVGMEFTVPAIGFFDRSKRYAMLVEDGVVKVLHLEKPGQCEVSTGEAMLETI